MSSSPEAEVEQRILLGQRLGDRTWAVNLTHATEWTDQLHATEGELEGDFGLARKPLFVVPNHTLGRFSSERLNLYPAANLLVATKEDFESGKRRELMGRIATGNWDSVIVTHWGFEKIPLSEQTKHDFFADQRHESNWRFVSSGATAIHGSSTT